MTDDLSMQQSIQFIYAFSKMHPLNYIQYNSLFKALQMYLDHLFDRLMRQSWLQTNFHATDQHEDIWDMRYEINLGLPEACEPTSFDGHMELEYSSTHCSERKQRIGVRE